MLTAAFWKKYFDVYDVLNELRPYRELLDTIVSKSRIRAGDRVLDAGAGTGNLAQRLAAAGAEVTGFDFSKEGLALFSLKLPHARVVVGDLSKPLPFPSDSFDCVCTNNTIYTLPREIHASVFAELYRVLKPGGRIVTSNIRDPFKPFRIYSAHIKEEIRELGVAVTVLKVARFVVPTIRIFYYNALIKKSDRTQSYHFFASGEQQALLRGAGFIEVSDDILMYAGQAILNFARKPR